MAGVLAGGIAVHAVGASISKRKQVRSRRDRAALNEQNLED